MLYEKIGDDPAALTAFNKGVELDENELSALNNSAWYLYKLDGDLKLALERSNRVVNTMSEDPSMRNSPIFAHTRHTLGCILLKLGRTSDAIEEFENSIRIKPDFASAFYHLAVAQEKNSKPELARKYYEFALQQAGETAPDWEDDARSRLKSLEPGAAE